MQLEVDLDSDVAPVTLTGVDEFTRLAVTVSGDPDADRMASVLGGWGIVADGHVWLEIAELERAVRAHPDRVTDWLPRFVSMIDYAESKGWVDGENRRVRAHCERVVRS